MDRDLANSAEVMQFYCRVAAEIGADLVKCVWPGTAEAFAKVTETCTAPVLLTGGRRRSDQRAHSSWLLTPWGRGRRA